MVGRPLARANSRRRAVSSAICSTVRAAPRAASAATLTRAVGVIGVTWPIRYMTSNASFDNATEVSSAETPTSTASRTETGSPNLMWMSP